MYYVVIRGYSVYLQDHVQPDDEFISAHYDHDEAQQVYESFSRSYYEDQIAQQAEEIRAERANEQALAGEYWGPEEMRYEFS